MPIYYCKSCDDETEHSTPWGALCRKCRRGGLTPITKEVQASNQVRREAAAKEKERIRIVALSHRKANELLPVGKLPDAVLAQIFGYLDERALALITLVCHRWPPIIEYVRRRYVPEMRAYGSTSGLLKNVLIGKGGLLVGKRSVAIAVDQFPYPASPKGSILKFILDTRMKVQLSLGTDDRQTIVALSGKGNRAQLVAGYKKMHNKIWIIDNEEIIVGSPNVSFSGLEGGNLESFVVIKSPRLGLLFSRYLMMLNDTTVNAGPPGLLFDQITRELGVYNQEQHGLKIALAPMINITDFVVKQLEGATKIIVRQFLISHKSRNDTSSSFDIVSVLAAMAKNKVEIEIVLDKDAFHKQDFVQEAAWTLHKAGCKVYTQEPVTIVKTREALMHDKLILAEIRGGVKRTLIGSAGFTTSVIENENAESFVSIDLNHIFENLLEHHAQANVKFPMQEIAWKE